MDLHVLAVGKLKDAGLETLCETWATRSRPWHALRRQACRDTAAIWAKARALGGPVVLLDERGEQIDSPTLAQWIGRWRDDGARHVAFAIGDAHGFSAEDRDAADRVLALSRLTLPHRLAQVVLCEQLYRAVTILAGHPYHHA